MELRLVLEACYELDRLDVEDLSPARFILEHGFEHRLGLGGRSEELDDLLDLVGDDGVEDHVPTIGQGEARVFGLSRRVAYSFALARSSPHQPSRAGPNGRFPRSCWAIPRSVATWVRSGPALWIIGRNRVGVTVSLLQPDCDEYGKHEDNNEQDERGCPEQTLPPSPPRPIVARNAR